MLNLIIKLLACILVAMLTETTNIWSYVAPSNKIPNSNDLESSTVFLFSPSFLLAPPSFLLLSRMVSLSPGSELENSVEVRSTRLFHTQTHRRLRTPL